MPLRLVLVLDFKYSNTSGKLPDKYGNFRKRSVEAEIVFLSVSDKNTIFVFVFSVAIFIFVYTRISIKSQKQFPVIENFRFRFQP